MAQPVLEYIYRYLAERRAEYLEMISEALGKRAEDLSPVDLAVEYVARGGDPEKISSLLSWRDFEDFVSRAMELAGMESVRGVRAPPPRGFEIDVLGVDPAAGLAVAVDCKHWSRVRGVGEVARDMEERVGRALSRCDLVASRIGSFRRARDVYAVVVLLREAPVRSYGRVLIAPIYRFRDLLAGLRGYAEELGVKPYHNPCYQQKHLGSYIARGPGQPF